MEPQIIRCLEPKPADSPPLLKEELYRTDAHDFNLVRLDANLEKPAHPYDVGGSFMMVLSGLLHLVVDGQVYDLKAGEIALIPKGAVRGFTTGPEGATMLAAHLRD